jgi:hypothetical protein
MIFTGLLYCLSAVESSSSLSSSLSSSNGMCVLNIELSKINVEKCVLCVCCVCMCLLLWFFLQTTMQYQWYYYYYYVLSLTFNSTKRSEEEANRTRSVVCRAETGWQHGKPFSHFYVRYVVVIPHSSWSSGRRFVQEGSLGTEK